MRSLPDPGFAGDDGGVDPAVSAALAAYDLASESAEADQHHATLAALQESRVVVPVVAVLGDLEYDDQGLAHDKTSVMAAVHMTGRDGRTALLAFTGSASLIRWTQSYAGSDSESDAASEARPVPVTLRQAAQAAIQEDSSALLIDVAGPVLLAVEGEDLRALAEGRRLVRLEDGRYGWASPAG